MSNTLSRGYKTFNNAEKGWWDDVNANFTRTNDHTHNSTDSAPIPTKNLSKGTSSIAHASWTAVSGVNGLYKQTITLPDGYTMATAAPTFYLDSGSGAGSQIFPSIEMASSTSYVIYFNDNSLDVKAVYA